MRNEPTREYRAELDELQEVYRLTARSPVDEHVRHILTGRHAYMIASGGAAPAAVLAAELHAEQVGGTAETISPLAFMERRRKPTGSVAVLFSARARHPDSAMAVAHALAGGLDVVLFTSRAREDLPRPFHSTRVFLVTVPSTRPKDGFLATGSVLAMACAAARVYGCDVPETLQVLPIPPTPAADPLIVLHGSAGRAAAIDVQIRHEELGLASVETADYRNFAHGRHVGLGRRADRAHVVALVTPETEALAERTLQAVPAQVAVSRVVAPSSGIAGSLQLLASAMQMPVAAAASQLLSPSHPPILAFGRELYHLPFKRMYPPPADDPVTRKLSTIGVHPSAATATVREAYYAWRRWARRQDISTLVLDYDGTCVETKDRYELPRQDVRDALLGILGIGLNLAFASGRGGSLYSDLQAWVPARFHPQIVLGLHNGSWRQSLDEPLRGEEHELDWVEPLAAHLGEYSRMGAISVRRAATQLGVEPTSGATTVAAAHAIVATAVRVLELPVQVTVSGHSVDVLPEASGKAPFLIAMQLRFGNALAIGDQGAPGGNDFPLLSATKLSVSVDTCSPSLDRCWQLARAGRRGPDALLDVIGMLHTQNERTRLVPPLVKNGD
jgi:fructoselysine-6-P-deglycase FrlB-like protein